MNDYTWPSVYFSYLFFTICLLLAIYFFLRSRKDGYWSKESEEIKYRVFEENGQAEAPAPRGATHGTDQR
jgi:hypothetical protein